jgi:ATP-dependent DNA helicase RecG
MRESETCEMKKSLAELKEGLISIVAILNEHRYGELWFGIASNGKTNRMEVTEKTLRDVSQAIAAHIEPRIYPQVTHEKIRGADCIKVIFEGQEVPYYAYGRAYIRVADQDRQIGAKELENLIVAKNREQLWWDNEPCRTAISDLDKARVRRFVERARLRWDTTENALDKLGLLREGKLVNAPP